MSAGFTSLAELLYTISDNNTANSDHDSGRSFTHAFVKNHSSSEQLGTWQSCWPLSGNAGATPAGTPGTQYVNASGSMFIQDISAERKFLTSMGYFSTDSSSLMIYDRLHAVNFSVASTGSKTINSTAPLPRYADGYGVQAWYEGVGLITGATGLTIQLESYTDDAGNAGSAGPNFAVPLSGTSILANASYAVPLESGDLGIRAVASVNVISAASTGTMNISLIRPIAIVKSQEDSWSEVDFVRQINAYMRIYDGASLALMFLCDEQSPGAGFIVGTASIGWSAP